MTDKNKALEAVCSKWINYINDMRPETRNDFLRAWDNNFYLLGNTDLLLTAQSAANVRGLKAEVTDWTKDLLNNQRSECAAKNPGADNEWGQEEWLIMEIAVREYIDHLASRNLLRTPALSQPQWLPIESAPKDGTSVLVYAPYGGGFITQSYWKAMPNNGHMWVVDCGEICPTHWMPLPQKPGGGE